MMELNYSRDNQLEHVIRAVRKHMGLNQAAIASMLNVNQSTYSKIERGMVSTSAENWLMFAHILGINFDAPLTGFIEVQNKLKPENDPKMLPEKFRQRNLLSTRLFFQMLNIMYSKGHKKEVDHYFEKEQIDVDYFRVTNKLFDTSIAEELLHLIGKSQDQHFFEDSLSQHELDALFGKELTATRNGFYFIKDFVRKSGHFDNIIQYTVRQNDPTELTLIMETSASSFDMTLRNFVSNSILNTMTAKFSDIMIKDFVKCETLTRIDFKLEAEEKS